MPAASRLSALPGIVAGIAALAALASAAAYITLIGLGNDTNTLLHYALYMLRDGQVYTRWMEINPPLILLLYTPVAALIAYANAASAPSLHIYAVLLSLVSLAMLRQSLQAHSVERALRRYWLSAAAFILLAVPSFFSVFADREHLLYIFALPWIAQMLLRLRPTWYSVPFAGIGFCIKPFNLLLFLALLLLAGPKEDTLCTRLRAPALKVVMGMGAAYLVIIALFFRDYLQLNLPLAQAYHYISEIYAFRFAWMMFLLIPSLLVLMLAYPKNEAGNARDRRMWEGMLAASAALFVLNGGWFYVAYPQMCALMLLCFSILAPDRGDGQRMKWPAKVSALLAMLLALLGSVAQGVGSVEETRSTGSAFGFHALPPEIMQRLRSEAGERFIMLSTHLWGANISRFTQPPYHVFGYDYLWTVPWLYAHPDAPAAPRVRRALTDELLRALALRPTATLIIDASPVQRKMPDNTDLYAFLTAMPELKKPLSHYTQRSIIDTCDEHTRIRCRFTIWRTGGQ